jgi:hypothetical protein
VVFLERTVYSSHKEHETDLIEHRLCSHNGLVKFNRCCMRDNEGRSMSSESTKRGSVSFEEDASGFNANNET